MKPKVFITKRVASEVQAFLGEHCDYEIWDAPGLIPRPVLLEKVREVDGILNHACRIDQELLAHAPRVKVVSNISVGYNNFEIEAFRQRRVIGTNTPGVLNETVADLAMALILTSARRIVELDKYVKDGRWDGPVGEPLFGSDVHHMTLGIIGMGGVGEALARRAKHGFSMDICYYNRNPRADIDESLEARYLLLDELLQESDFVVILTPLTRETQNLIGHRELNLMKRTAFLINASRGETVAEEALVAALKDNIIKGAALDVYRKEPVDPDNELLKLSNIVTVPHIGSAVKKTRDAMAMLAARNLVAVLNGESAPNVIVELK